jgi:hypothetical protein
MNKGLAYQERVCLFIDILGFKAWIDASDGGKAASGIKSGPSPEVTVDFLHRVLSLVSGVRADDMSGISLSVAGSKQASQFSDSLVVSYQVDEPDAIFFMLYDILLLQIELIQHGVLIRGAVTLGKLFHDENLVFGPALVEAAELEKLAMYPRVILDREILTKGSVDMHGAPDHTLRNFLKQDLDGMFYIDYFGVSAGEFDAGNAGLANHLIALRDIVKRMSHLTRNPSIRLKHSWMRQKFNVVAEQIQNSKRIASSKALLEDADFAWFNAVTPFK